MTRRITSVCPRDCYDTCSVEIQVDRAGRPIRMAGDRHHAITQGFLCPRGRKDLERLTVNRITSAALRRDPKPGRGLVECPPDGALGRVADELQRVLDRWGPEKVLLLDYAGNMGTLVSDFPNRLWAALGAVRTDGAVCSRSGKVAIARHYGNPYGVLPDQLPNQQLVVIWGFNPAVSAPHIWSLAARARRQGNAGIVAVDPRRSETAVKADIWIRPRPGTDALLAAGVARCLRDSDQIDREFLSRWSAGWPAYEDGLAAISLETVSQRTTVPAAAIHDLAEAYARSRPSATLIGIGLQKAAGGADAARAVSLLPALCGQHRGFFYSNSSAFTVDTTPLTGWRQGSPVVSQVGIGERLMAGEFKFVFIKGMNPVMTLPGQTAVRSGLSRPDVFVALHDTHWTETAEYADAVIPAPSWLEKDDLVVPWGHDWVQKSNAALPPPADAHHEIAVMRDLARRLGLRQPALYEDPWGVLRGIFQDQFENGNFGDLMAGATLRLKKWPADHYPTASHRIDFDPPDIGIPLPVDAAPLSDAKDGQWVLLNSSLSHYTHSQFQDIYGPLPAIVQIHPADAAACRIGENDSVRLENHQGSVTVTARITDAVPPGVLWCPRPFAGLCGTPLNTLTSAEPQPIGGGSRFNSTRVRIRPVKNDFPSPVDQPA